MFRKLKIEFKSNHTKYFVLQADTDMCIIDVYLLS